jgi:hypothetical protein
MNRPKGCMRGPFANAHGPEFYHHGGIILDFGYWQRNYYISAI